MSKESLTVGALTAAPGSRVTGFLSASEVDEKVPVTLICGAGEGKTVVICSGTHGAEFLGVETALQLSRALNPQEVCGNVIFTHPSNQPQFWGKTAYVGPDDGKNLNRVFPGKAKGTVSERIAYLITTQLLSRADFLIDMHSGDIHETLTPYVLHSKLGTPKNNELSAQAAALMGAAYHAYSEGKTGAIGYCALQGIPGILPEIGEGARWTQPEVEAYARGIRNVLKFLKVLPGEPENLGDSKQVESNDVLSASQDGLFYPNVEPADAVEKGELIGVLKDFWGTVLEEYRAEKDGHVLFMASALSVKKNDPIVGIG